MTAHEFMNLQDAQVALARQWARLFEAFDVVLTPAFGTVAYPHVEIEDMSLRRLVIDGRETGYFDQLAWPGVALLPNLPATVAPLGLSAAGLPIAVQILGGHLEDRTTIAFAGLLAREFGGFRAPPGLS